MITHITNINNIAGTAPLAQENVSKIAHQLDMREIGLFLYPVWTDSDQDLSRRMDGIIASIHPNDIVIFQYPSWNHDRYDNAFINSVKSFPNVKLVIWVEDVETLMFNSGIAALSREIQMFNRADLLILPSKGMHDILRENGLTQNNVLYQTVWDHKTDSVYTVHQKHHRMFFTGEYSRFPFLANYHGNTPIFQYATAQPERENDISFQYQGFRSPDALLHILSEGGFGLVWSEETYFDRYYSFNQPHKLGFFLAAGIPVIVKKGCVHEEYVVNNHLGYAVDSLEEADSIIQNITDEEYDDLYSHITNIQALITSGVYTSKLLQDSVLKLLDPYSFTK